MATPSGDPMVFPPLQTETYGSQLIWLAITFVLLYWAMAKFVVPRLTAIVEGRSARITKDLDAAAKAKSQVAEAVAAYEAAMTEARTKANGLAQKARDDLAAKTDATRKTLEADLAKKLAKAESQIAKRRDQAMAQVHGIAADTTGAIVAQILGKAPSAGAVEKALASVTPKDAG